MTKKCHFATAPLFLSYYLVIFYLAKNFLIEL